MSDTYKRGWIGVDFDGTAAEYLVWDPKHPLGKPIEPMIARIKIWLLDGRDVRWFTARACQPDQIPLIEAWSLEHVGQVLPVTNVKDFEMAEMWDDRAHRVRRNHGAHECCSHHA